MGHRETGHPPFDDGADGVWLERRSSSSALMGSRCSWPQASIWIFGAEFFPLGASLPFVLCILFGLEKGQCRFPWVPFVVKSFSSAIAGAGACARMHELEDIWERLSWERSRDLHPLTPFLIAEKVFSSTF